MNDPTAVLAACRAEVARLRAIERGMTPGPWAQGYNVLDYLSGRLEGLARPYDGWGFAGEDCDCAGPGFCPHEAARDAIDELRAIAEVLGVEVSDG